MIFTGLLYSNRGEPALYETSRAGYYLTLTEWKKVASATYNPAYGAVGIVWYHILLSPGLLWMFGLRSVRY